MLSIFRRLMKNDHGATAIEYTLIASLIWGSIGSGFFIYGKKQSEPITLFGGLALVAISYFIESALIMSLVGAALVAGIFWLRRRF